MSSAHFLHDPSPLVNASLLSQTQLNPALALDAAHKILYRRPRPSSSRPPAVSLVSGGGAGHEPAFAGYVGRGLLAAAVSGSIFASPSAEQIRVALLGRVDGLMGVEGRGVLVVVMNYTGDVLNFGLGVEKARGVVAARKGGDGRPGLEMVVVGDDVGVPRSVAGKVGRRGIAGTVLVVKIAGALAEEGRSLAEVKRVAELVAQNLVSVGASLSRVHVPGRRGGDEPSAAAGLAEGEVEIGMGIHNEAGSDRKRLALPDLVDEMLNQLLSCNDPDRSFVAVNSNEVVVLVNNLGGVSPLEMGGITAEVLRQLRSSWNLRPVRIYAGTFMSSLNGQGFSVSLLNVVNTDIGGPGMVELLDRPCEGTGWGVNVARETWDERSTLVYDDPVWEDAEAGDDGVWEWDAEAATTALKEALRAVVASEPEITRFDSVVGDGDCGIGMRRGAEALLTSLETTPLTNFVIPSLTSITSGLESSMDGTSGALCSILLTALIHNLRSVPPPSTARPQICPAVWAQALAASLTSLQKYTPAQPGDRTMMDALQPFVDVLGKTADVGRAVEAARVGAEGTKGMRARLGRGVYVGGDGWRSVPDAGAWGVAMLLSGLVGSGRSLVGP